MDWVSEILGLGTWTAVDTAKEKLNNEIIFENFIVQGAEKGVLLDKKSPDCTDPPDKKSALVPFFDCLTKPEVGSIESQGFSYWMMRTIYKVTQDKVKLAPDYLQKALTKDAGVQEMLKCYDVDYKKLSDMLSKYVYNESDQFKALTGGAPIIRHKKRKTRRKRRGTKSCKK